MCVCVGGWAASCRVPSQPISHHLETWDLLFAGTMCHVPPAGVILVTSITCSQFDCSSLLSRAWPMYRPQK